VPLSFSLSGTRIPTKTLAALAGRSSIPAEGSWDATAEGRLRGAELFRGTAPFHAVVQAFRFSLRGRSPSLYDVAFDSIEADGRKEGDAISGELRTSAPDGRLGYSVELREGYPFRAHGPFSVGNRREGEAEESRDRFAMSGRVELAGSLESLERTSGSLQVETLRYKGGGVDVSGKGLSARLDPEGIRWAGGTLVVSGNPVTASGKVSWKGELDARLEGRMPAASVRLATDVFDRLDGTITMNLRVSGRVDNPTVVGTGRLEGGVFSFKGYGQLFEEMRADAIISREKIVFEHFDGRSGGGYIDGRGELPLRFDAGQRMFFSVDFLDMRYPYPEDFRPVLQGHAELVGPVENLLVTGDIEIQQARYTRTIRPQRLLLDFKKRMADVTARRERDEFRVRLDINVVADGTIEIRNNLAKATAKGEFKVAGDTSRVVILGAFDLLEGKIDFQGDVYEVKHLSLDFNDPRRNNPRIEARAETKKNNYLVTVLVTGTLEKYEVDLVSDPPLGKNDIVSLLSLGVTSRSLQGQEGSVGASLGTSIILGPYKGRVEEGIRGLVGLDKLAVEAAFSSVTKSFEPRFIVGKTFGDRLAVSVSTLVGATSDSSANVEFKLLENVFLQGSWQSATTQKTGDMGADIKFKYRYRTFRDFLGDPGR
jgi:autotransporter translocation and assembly factor TamB